MSSPTSGFIAEAVLQQLESLLFRHHMPKFWARYVDDSFVVIDLDQLLTFKKHLNAVFPDIQFTMEEEENNQLAFLDVLVCRNDCGDLRIGEDAVVNGIAAPRMMDGLGVGGLKSGEIVGGKDSSIETWGKEEEEEEEEEEGEWDEDYVMRAVGICDWDQRTYTTLEGKAEFMTVRSGRYSTGYIGEVPFVSKRLSQTTCYLGDVAFRCVYANNGSILGTHIVVPNITNVDRIYIASTYPVTVHRIEKHVRDKSSKDRFIVEENMHLTKCPEYMQTKLVWKFPGSVADRTDFECFRDGSRLCRGTTTTMEAGKCDVTVDGGNLIHTRTVNGTKNVLEFFYCHLSPSTPHHALTYNIDWRASKPIPPGGIPTDAPVTERRHAMKTTSAAKHLTGPLLIRCEDRTRFATGLARAGSQSTTLPRRLATGGHNLDKPTTPKNPNGGHTDAHNTFEETTCGDNLL
nr:unnamed protein product [Spirometra erinaceieuropaei]